MKKTMFLLLLIAACFTSCKKENLIVQNDFERNKEIDKELFDKVGVVPILEIEKLVQEKREVLARIIKANPKISFKQIAPKRDNVAFKDVCLDQYSSDKFWCNFSLGAGLFVSVATGVAVGALVGTATGGTGAGVGVGVGTVMVSKDVLNYIQCCATAIRTRDNCINKK